MLSLNKCLNQGCHLVMSVGQYDLGPSTQDDFDIHSLLCATCLIVWMGKSSKKSVLHDVNKLCRTWGEKPPHVLLWEDKFDPWIKTINETIYSVAMTTK